MYDNIDKSYSAYTKHSYKNTWFDGCWVHLVNYLQSFIYAKHILVCDSNCYGGICIVM